MSAVRQAILVRLGGGH